MYILNILNQLHSSFLQQSASEQHFLPKNTTFYLSGAIFYSKFEDDPSSANVIYLSYLLS